MRKWSAIPEGIISNVWLNGDEGGGGGTHAPTKKMEATHGLAHVTIVF
jgi:hypothetical protein